MRTVMHVDLDAFYSSIVQRDPPELRGKAEVSPVQDNSRVPSILELRKRTEQALVSVVQAPTEPQWPQA